MVIGLVIVRALGLAIILTSTTLLASLAWPWRGLDSAGWLMLVLATGGSFTAWTAAGLVAAVRAWRTR